MIRHARPDDHAAISVLVEAAFGQPDEARLVEELRANGDVIFELVAKTEDGTIEGHVLYSRLWADSVMLYAALAPLSVAPQVQKTGIGSRLMKASLDTAREFGIHGIILLGSPAYYQRFGFTAEAARKGKSPFSGSPAFMALALESDALVEPLTIAYADAFAT
jgi:putative acetyltransferase